MAAPTKQVQKQIKNFCKLKIIGNLGLKHVSQGEWHALPNSYTFTALKDCPWYSCDSIQGNKNNGKEHRTKVLSTPCNYALNASEKNLLGLHDIFF